MPCFPWNYLITSFSLVLSQTTNMMLIRTAPMNQNISECPFSSSIAAPTKSVSPSGSAAASAPNQSTAAESPTGGGDGANKSSDASTSSHQSGSHAPGPPGGRPPMHPTSTSPTTADFTIPLASFDTSKVPLGSKSGVSTGGTTPTGYRPGYSSGASTPTESLDGSRHAGAKHRGSTGSVANPKTLLHSSSILGLDKMIEDRKAEGNLTNNVVHMEVSELNWCIYVCIYLDLCLSW